MAYLLDTNIIIEIEKGNSDLADFINSSDCYIDATVYMECLQGSKSNAEKTRRKKALQGFPIIYFNASITALAIDLIDKYAQSHTLFMPDALIAAACIDNGIELLTYNIKDFRFISDLKIIKPPFPIV